jgi:hypothetical protein
MGQESLDLGRAEFPGVTPLMKNDVATDPLQIRLFRPVGKMTGAHSFPGHFQQSSTLHHVGYLPDVLCDVPPYGEQSNQGDRRASSAISGVFGVICHPISVVYL